MNFILPQDKQFYLGSIDFCKLEAKAIAVAYLDNYPELQKWMSKIYRKNTIPRRIFLKKLKGKLK